MPLVTFFKKLTQNYIDNLKFVILSQKYDYITKNGNLEQNIFEQNLTSNIHDMLSKTLKVFPSVSDDHFIYILESGNLVDKLLHAYLYGSRYSDIW